ncbi:MAG TPA: adenylate/guanylate cyclase domain-containing protein, partial [Gemmatimonadales bacterium]|nr:adenylate/guanylate cyclase domain-containing protein [Gemmatimonadales bacterium]
MPKAAGRTFPRQHPLTCSGNPAQSQVRLPEFQTSGPPAMAQPELQRRLIAILVADMVGYSRLMELDGPGTLARLKTHRLELIDPALAKTKGRMIKTTGDGMLVEFASVVDAVLCAIEIQLRMARRNADVEPDYRMRFRIGIHLGDVIVEGDDVFGDGVNVAARLQQLAEPGGICVSGAVYDQLGSAVDVRFEDMGEQHVKNIGRPIRTYRAVLDEHKAAKGLLRIPSPPHSANVEQPSIAVLPFVNMSGDPDQEFFADGLTEDIITALSRFREFLVISRNSTFVYKRRAVNVQEVAKALAAQYFVEGSVRKVGGRVRITVQLIDAPRDRHIWAERYDRELQDIFAIQDEVTSSIVATLPGRVEAATHERIKRKPTENMVAYELVLAAKVLHHRARKQDNLEAQKLIESALALDPNYAHAHAWRACIIGQAWVYNWCPDRDAAFETVTDELKTALALDDNDSDVHRILAAVHLSRGEHEAADYHQQRALALNPNNDLIVVQQGELYTWLGLPEKGIEWIRKAMRLNPHHPERFWNHLG